LEGKKIKKDAKNIQTKNKNINNNKGNIFWNFFDNLKNNI
jgi:hypothetical protein